MAKSIAIVINIAVGCTIHIRTNRRWMTAKLLPQYFARFELYLGDVSSPVAADYH